MADLRPPPPAQRAAPPDRVPPPWRGLLKVDLIQAARRWTSDQPLATAALTLTLILSLAIAWSAPWINGPSHWRWFYTPWGEYWLGLGRALLHLTPFAAALGALAWLAAHRLRGAWQTFILLGLLVLWGILFCWQALGSYSEFGITHLGRTIQSPVASGYQTVATASLDGDLPPPRQLLRDYHLHQHQMPLHPSTHPPGQVLLTLGVLWLFREGLLPAEAIHTLFGGFGFLIGAMHDAPPSDRLAAMATGNLLLLAGLLVVFPLFGLVRDGWGKGPAARRAAWAAVLLWVHYPALHVFTPQWVQLHALIGTSAIWFASRAIQGQAARAAAWGAAAGAVLALGAFMSFTQLLWPPLLLLMAILTRARRAGHWSAAISPLPRAGDASLASAIFGALAMGAALWLVAELALGVDMRRIFLAGLESNNQFRAGAGRPYAVWLFYSPWDMLFVAGPALALPGMIFLIHSIRRALHRPEQLMPAWAVYPLAVVLVTLSGLMPGENARLYLPFAPGLAWAAGGWITLRARARFPSTLTLLLVAQVMFFFVLRLKIKFMVM